MFAVFPLNIVVLPGESVALHLFETRYKQLFQDFRNGKEFVILFCDKSGMADYGSLVFIEKIINEFPDETVDVIVKGRSIIKINRFHKLYPTKLYSAVEGEVIKVEEQVGNELKELYQAYLFQLGKKMNNSEPNVYQLANRLELSLELKKELLEQHTQEELNCFLINAIRMMGKIYEQESLLKDNFHWN